MLMMTPHNKHLLFLRWLAAVAWAACLFAGVGGSVRGGLLNLLVHPRRHQVPGAALFPRPPATWLLPKPLEGR
jgi:hypothetical protein